VLAVVDAVGAVVWGSVVVAGIEKAGGDEPVALGAIGAGVEPPRVASTAAATPAAARIGSAIRTASGGLRRREGRGRIT
jgi:hypothetical protein